MRRYAPLIFITVLIGALLMIGTAGEARGGQTLPGKGEYRIKVRRIERRTDRLFLFGGNILVSTFDRDKELREGDILRVIGRLEPVGDIKNKGYADYLRSRGIACTLQAERIEHLASEKNIFYYIGSVREKLRNRIEGIFRQESPLIKALIYGEREEISKEMQEIFARTGISHIIAISGFHIGMLAGAALWMTKRLPAKLRYAFALFLIFFFVLVTGARPSAVRAGVFYLLLIASVLLGREYDLISASCMTASLFIAGNPYLIYDRGFALSFLAVLSIGMFHPILRKYVRRCFGSRLADRGAVQVLLLTVSAQLLTLPLSCYYFGKLSLVAGASNILSLPLITLFYPLVFGALLFFELPLIGAGFRTLALADLRLFLRINEALSSFSRSCIEFSQPSPSAVVLMYIFIFGGYGFLLYRELKENANAACGFEEAY